MNKENEKYSIEKMYLKEFQFFNGEYDITFNIVDINIDKMIVNLQLLILEKSALLNTIWKEIKTTIYTLNMVVNFQK